MSGLDAGTAPETISAEDYKEAFSKFPTAVSVIATDGEAGRAGMTCSAVFSVSDNPPTIGLCVNRSSAANEVIKANGVLCVNCLNDDQQEISQIFAGVGGLPWQARFEIGNWGVLESGLPYNKDALVALDCKLIGSHEVGTHSILIAQVRDAALGKAGGPLIYQNRNYAMLARA